MKHGRLTLRGFDADDCPECDGAHKLVTRNGVTPPMCGGCRKRLKKRGKVIAPRGTAYVEGR